MSKMRFPTFKCRVRRKKLEDFNNHPINTKFQNSLLSIQSTQTSTSIQSHKTSRPFLLTMLTQKTRKSSTIKQIMPLHKWCILTDRPEEKWKIIKEKNADGIPKVALQVPNEYNNIVENIYLWVQMNLQKLKRLQKRFLQPYICGQVLRSSPTDQSIIFAKMKIFSFSCNKNGLVSRWILYLLPIENPDHVQTKTYVQLFHTIRWLWIWIWTCWLTVQNNYKPFLKISGTPKSKMNSGRFFEVPTSDIVMEILNLIYKT